MTEGLGHPGYNLFIFVICLIINIAIILSLTQSYGNIGIALGRFAGFGTMFLSVYYVEKWMFGRVQTSFWGKLVGILGVSSVCAVAAENFIIGNLDISWFTFVWAVFAGGIIYCLIVWLLGFISDEEKLLVRNIINR